MFFFAIGSGKAFDDTWKDKIYFFEEIWAIYNLDEGLPVIPSNNPSDWEYLLPSINPDALFYGV